MDKKPFVTLEQLREIEKTYPTPFYLYDERGIKENAARLKQAFSWNKGYKEYFAVKATPNPFLLNILKDMGCGTDCSSMTELMMSKACGFSGPDIMFSSNDTPPEEFAYAEKLGAIINLDDITHIQCLEETLGHIPETISCRFNPGGLFKISNDIMDNPGDSKYGMTTEQIGQAFKILKEKGAKHFGIHAFLASNTVTMFAPMAAGLAYWFKDKRAKFFFWLVTLCMCFSCLFTMSRGAWVAMAVTILIFALLVDRRLIGLMCIALVCSLFLPFVASRIGYLLTPEFAASTNNGGRGSRWDIALGYLAMSPVFGFGLGMFGGAVAMQTKVYSWISYFYVDNYYLKILVEMGYVGFTVFLLMLLFLLLTGLRAVYRTAKAPKESTVHPLCAGMFAGLCGVLVHCYFENIFEEPYMMAYFWAIAAMIVYLGFFRGMRTPTT